MKTKTKLLLIFLSFLLSLLLLIFASVFLIEKIKMVSEKILEIKKEDLTLSQRIERLREFQKIKRTRGKELLELENILFSKDLPLPFITFLEEMAKEKGLSIEISMQELPQKKEKEIFPSVYFGIKMKGSFAGIITFLQKIEKSQFLTQIEKLRISKAEGENLEGEVLIKVFVKEQ